MTKKIQNNEIYDYGTWYESDEIGSRSRKSKYNKKHDRIVCGCLTHTLKGFEDRVHKVYPEGHKHRIEYDNFITFCRNLK